MISGVYKITNIKTNKCYIGSSKDIIGRFYKHKTSLKFNKHHSVKLQRSYNKYGAENFKYEIIEECENDFLIINEQKNIDLYNSYKKGYNSLPIAGRNFGMKHSDETKEKLRKASMGNKNMLNKKHTDETKEKIRMKLKGIPLSEETKLKMSKSGKGRTSTEETKLKQRNSHLGKKLSEEHKNKLRLCHLGKKQNVERIAHRVKLNTGQKRSKK